MCVVQLAEVRKDARITLRMAHIHKQAKKTQKPIRELLTKLSFLSEQIITFPIIASTTLFSLQIIVILESNKITKTLL
jgi:hypothetical protein